MSCVVMRWLVKSAAQLVYTQATPSCYTTNLTLFFTFFTPFSFFNAPRRFFSSSTSFKKSIDSDKSSDIWLWECEVCEVVCEVEEVRLGGFRQMLMVVVGVAVVVFV